MADVGIQDDTPTVSITVATNHAPGTSRPALIPAVWHQPRRPRPNAAWLAAYALGLAHTRQCMASCLDDLIIAAGSDLGVVREARRGLQTLETCDVALRLRADALLTRVATRLTRTGAVEHACGG